LSQFGASILKRCQKHYIHTRWEISCRHARTISTKPLINENIFCISTFSNLLGGMPKLTLLSHHFSLLEERKMDNYVFSEIL
jgi:hypothetical protein